MTVYDILFNFEGRDLWMSVIAGDPMDAQEYLRKDFPGADIVSVKAVGPWNQNEELH